MQNNNLVYSTDKGRITEPKISAEHKKGDGIVRIKRETKGRKGKGVTTIHGLDISQEELKKLCSKLKKECGTGGAVKDNVLEIQGDNREKIKASLEKLNYTVKLAGG
jgi:translation initiation factor 1